MGASASSFKEKIVITSHPDVENAFQELIITNLPAHCYEKLEDLFGLYCRADHDVSRVSAAEFFRFIGDCQLAPGLLSHAEVDSCLPSGIYSFRLRGAMEMGQFIAATVRVAFAVFLRDTENKEEDDVLSGSDVDDDTDDNGHNSDNPENTRGAWVKKTDRLKRMHALIETYKQDLAVSVESLIQNHTLLSDSGDQSMEGGHRHVGGVVAHVLSYHSARDTDDDALSVHTVDVSETGSLANYPTHQPRHSHRHHQHSHTHHHRRRNDDASSVHSSFARSESPSVKDDNGEEYGGGSPEPDATADGLTGEVKQESSEEAFVVDMQEMKDQELTALIRANEGQIRTLFSDYNRRGMLASGDPGSTGRIDSNAFMLLTKDYCLHPDVLTRHEVKVAFGRGVHASQAIQASKSSRASPSPHSGGGGGGRTGATDLSFRPPSLSMRGLVYALYAAARLLDEKSCEGCGKVVHMSEWMGRERPSEVLAAAGQLGRLKETSRRAGFVTADIRALIGFPVCRRCAARHEAKRPLVFDGSSGGGKALKRANPRTPPVKMRRLLFWMNMSQRKRRADKFITSVEARSGLTARPPSTLLSRTKAATEMNGSPRARALPSPDRQRGDKTSRSHSNPCEDGGGEGSGKRLRFAAKAGDFAVVRACCVSGQLPTKDVSQAILLAAKYGHFQVLMFLLKLDADLNTHTKDGMRALHWAAVHGSTTGTEALLKKGSPVDASDVTGCTALHLAAHHGFVEVAKLLVTYGASPNTSTNKGDSPLELALRGRKEQMIIFLQGVMAREDQEGDAQSQGLSRRLYAWLTEHSLAHVAPQLASGGYTSLGATLLLKEPDLLNVGITYRRDRLQLMALIEEERDRMREMETGMIDVSMGFSGGWGNSVAKILETSSKTSHVHRVGGGFIYHMDGEMELRKLARKGATGDETIDEILGETNQGAGEDEGDVLGKNDHTDRLQLLNDDALLDSVASRVALQLTQNMSRVLQSTPTAAHPDDALDVEPSASMHPHAHAHTHEVAGGSVFAQRRGDAGTSGPCNTSLLHDTQELLGILHMQASARTSEAAIAKEEAEDLAGLLRGRLLWLGSLTGERLLETRLSATEAAIVRKAYASLNGSTDAHRIRSVLEHELGESVPSSAVLGFIRSSTVLLDGGGRGGWRHGGGGVEGDGDGDGSGDEAAGGEDAKGRDSHALTVNVHAPEGGSSRSKYSFASFLKFCDSLLHGEQSLRVPPEKFVLDTGKRVRARVGRTVQKLAGYFETMRSLRMTAEPSDFVKVQLGRSASSPLGVEPGSHSPLGLQLRLGSFDATEGSEALRAVGASSAAGTALVLRLVLLSQPRVDLRAQWADDLDSDLSSRTGTARTDHTRTTARSSPRRRRGDKGDRSSVPSTARSEAAPPRTAQAALQQLNAALSQLPPALWQEFGLLTPPALHIVSPGEDPSARPDTSKPTRKAKNAKLATPRLDPKLEAKLVLTFRTDVLQALSIAPGAVRELTATLTSAVRLLDVLATPTQPGMDWPKLLLDALSDVTVTLDAHRGFLNCFRAAFPRTASRLYSQFAMGCVIENQRAHVPGQVGADVMAPAGTDAGLLGGLKKVLYTFSGMLSAGRSIDYKMLGVSAYQIVPPPIRDALRHALSWASGIDEVSLLTLTGKIDVQVQGLEALFVAALPDEAEFLRDDTFFSAAAASGALGPDL